MSRRVDQLVGEHIRTRRTELGLTQEQLAAALGVSYQQIQKYETGANRISAGRLFEIARHLGAELDYFFANATEETALVEGETPSVLEHGGRQRSAIELVRNFAQIEHPEVRAAVAGLVKSIVEHQEA